MEVKRISPEEFDCLKQFPDGAVPDPQMSRVAVAKDGDKLAGRIFIVTPPHIEGPWVEPEYRGGTLLKRLTEWAEQEMREIGAKKVFAYGFSPELEDYLKRLGYTRQPITVWAKEL